ncbi:MAG: coproporphyrinogen dehydrogenase HemZ [Clostridia bacterium]|nr:coproporphyrinogen dehydrogenase HemZ [Clostridia bacterium]
MVLYLQGHDYHFELQNVCRLFLPQECLVVAESDDTPSDGASLIARLEKQATETALSCRLQLTDYDETRHAQVANAHPAYSDECELVLCELLYELLSDAFHTTQDWGIVTGVRPVKLLRRLIAEEGEEKAVAHLRDRLFVSERKLSLSRTTLEAEDRILGLSKPESFSLYVSVPFCPSRCDYCSFVSQTVTRAAKLIPEYVDRLAEEIAFTGALAKELGLRLETVYFGGGTPTTLTPEQLATLTRAVEASFDLSTVREYTVEAGRPDTVTDDKLRVLKAAGVSRISINPQTLRDDVLCEIGRKHTVAQFYDAFEAARRCGHNNVNTDLIAGLPGDTYDGFCESVDGILRLAPESVTVHTLSMKRAANLTLQKRADYRGGDEAVRMVRYTAERLPQAGYHPYYLYRQSRTVGNQENVGWAKDGFEGLYNVYIMDETHTILGCGAGAVSKLKQPGTEYLERIFNYKFPYEYNSGLAEMLNRKNSVKDFYERIRL